MNEVTKQSYEEFTVSVSFALNIARSESIVYSAVTATDKVGTDVSSTVTDQSTVVQTSNAVSVKVRSGSESMSPYKLTFRCVTSAGHKWEHDVTMRVRER